MRRMLTRKARLHESGNNDDLKGMSPAQLLGVMWQLALDAWSFKERLDAEPRLQRDVVVLKRRNG